MRTPRPDTLTFSIFPNGEINIDLDFKKNSNKVKNKEKCNAMAYFLYLLNSGQMINDIVNVVVEDGNAKKHIEESEYILYNWHEMEKMAEEKIKNLLVTQGPLVKPSEAIQYNIKRSQ